ncbi:hypothetical protein SRHO_G00125700 [Serrasalmus rhombeus]
MARTLQRLQWPKGRARELCPVKVSGPWAVEQPSVPHYTAGLETRRPPLPTLMSQLTIHNADWPYHGRQAGLDAKRRHGTVGSNRLEENASILCLYQSPDPQAPMAARREDRKAVPKPHMSARTGSDSSNRTSALALNHVRGFGTTVPSSLAADMGAHGSGDCYSAKTGYLECCQRRTTVSFLNNLNQR